MSDSTPQIGVDESRLVRGGHGVLAEPDDMKVGMVLVVGAISLLIFFVGGVWAWWIMVRYEREFTPDGPAAIPAMITEYEVGIVNQRPFALDYHAQDKLTGQASQLGTYGYVDQRSGKVHVPVERAMAAVITEQQQRALQPPPPAPSADGGTELGPDGGTTTSPDALNQVPGQQAPVAPPSPKNP